MRTKPRVNENPNDVRDRILEAALHAFSEMGYDGAKTREIASRADVPLGLLRYYFGDKLKLWQAAVDHAFVEIRGGIAPLTAVGEAGISRDDPMATIRRGIRAHVHYVARNPEFARLMHDEGKRRGPRMRWLVDRHVKPMFEMLIPVITHIQDEGRLPKDIAALHFAYALIGAADIIFHQAEECRRVTGVDPSDPAVADAHARAVEYMLLGPPPTDVNPSSERNSS